MKHTCQIYETSELKIEFFVSFTHHGISFHRCIKNIHLLAVLKFATVQNEPKRAETK